jgi:hypothetical protein
LTTGPFASSPGWVNLWTRAGMGPESSLGQRPCVGWLEECRAVATRFDKLAFDYRATVKLAMIQRSLRLLPAHDSSDKVSANGTVYPWYPGNLGL